MLTIINYFLRPKLKNRIYRRIFLTKKVVLQIFKPYFKEKKILFIVGNQRSGTTMIGKVFENDLKSKSFDEFCELNSNDPFKLRLNQLPQVKKVIYNYKQEFITLKPLVESQNILKLLQYFANSKGLWMYRDYRDVASSNLMKFGELNGIENLGMIYNDRKKHWLTEYNSIQTKFIVHKFYSKDMNPYDAAVLMWYVRNVIFFELNLQNISSIRLCKYEELVSQPQKTIKRVYGWVNQKYPGMKIHKEIHSNSIKKGIDIEISKEIDELAKGLLKKLDIINSEHND